MKKLELSAFIQGRIDWIQEIHRFDPQSGWSQVNEKPGETNEKYRSYGEFCALCDIVERFELPVNLDPPRLPERDSIAPAQKASDAFQESVRLLEKLG